MPVSGHHTCFDPQATEALGTALASELEPGDVILLEGELAAGKTTFVRGVVRGLGGVAEHVSSPSFVIVQSYSCATDQVAVVHHVDLYRLEGSPGVLREIGIDELLSDPTAVVAVEWPRDSVSPWLPPASRVWRVALRATSGECRSITIGTG